MSFINTLASKLGFNNDEPKPSISPTPLITTLAKNMGADKPLPTLKPITTLNPLPTPKTRTINQEAIKEQNKEYVKFAVDVAQAFPRAVASIGQSIFNKMSPQNAPDEITANNEFAKFLFGNKPIRTFSKQIENTKSVVKKLAGEKLNTSENKSKALADFTAMPLVIAGSLLDLSGFGGAEKNILEKVLKGKVDDFIEQGTKEISEEGTHKLLREIGIDDQLAREKATLLAKTTTKKETRQVLEDTLAKHIQVVEKKAVTRVAELEAKKTGTDLVPAAYLSAKELDELNFLKGNLKSPEKLALAYQDTTPLPIRNANKVVNQENTKNFLDEVLSGRQEAKRLDNDIQIKQSKDAGVIPKDLKPDTKIKVYRVGDDIKSGDGIVLSKENAITRYGEKRAGGIKELEVSAKDLVKSPGLKDEFLYIPKKNISQVAETKALETARGGSKERKYITSAKASEKVEQNIKNEIGSTYDVKSNKELVKRANENVSKSIEEAKTMATTQSSDEAVATGISLTEHYSNEITSAGTKAEKLAIAKEAADVINKQAEILTEAGRTVQAASLLGKQTPEGILRTTARKIKEYNKANPTKKIPEITPEVVVDIIEQGKKIEGMADGLVKEVATKKLADKLSSLLPSSMWKKIVTVWKAGLLTGLKTSGVNISSNFFNGVAENIKNIPATGIDLASSWFTGTRTKALNLRGIGQGSKEGVKKGWDYLRTGVSKESGESALEFTKVNFDSAPGKAIGAYAEGVYRLLGTEDMPFFYGAFRRSLGEQALVTIKNEKKIFENATERSKFIQDFIDNPPKESMAIADLDAKIATFKNDTALGKTAEAIRNSSPIAEVILPFAKTPSAVATAMINYSPAGALHTLYRNFIKGPFNQKDFAEGLGRSVTGMGALWLGSELYKKGKISLGYPKDEKERANWEATGKTPNSILIDGKWVPLVTFGPAGSVLGIGGHVTKGQEETGSISGGVLSGLFGGIQGLTEQTFLTGVKNLTDAIGAPEKKGVSFAGGLLASVVPTIVSDFNKAFDEYERKSYGTITGPLKARIPGVRQTLPKKLDVWGQPLERNRSALGTAISPIRLSNTIQGPLNTEVERLKEVGEDIRPTKVDAVISSIKLDDVEHYKYQRLYGNLLTEGLTKLIENPQYQALSPEDQVKEWKKATKEIKGAVSDVILPLFLKQRYNLPDTIDLQTVTQLTTELYKKSPDFAKADPEKQAKVILKLLESK